MKKTQNATIRIETETSKPVAVRLTFDPGRGERGVEKFAQGPRTLCEQLAYVAMAAIDAEMFRIDAERDGEQPPVDVMEPSFAAAVVEASQKGGVIRDTRAPIKRPPVN